MLQRWLIAVSMLAPALALAAGLASDVKAVLAADKAASGGTRWDAVTSLELQGTLHAGGLDGSFRTLQDLARARSVTSYRLGPVAGADGYDGEHGWTQDPGGEVAMLDAPESRRRARRQAWLDVHGYWDPQRWPARYGALQRRRLDGLAYAVIEATPADGEPVTLFFDAATHRLARIVQPQGQDTTTTVLSDWRELEGLSLPFHVVTDWTDAAGRTDPRRRTELRIERGRVNVALADTDFAPPQMTETARIEHADGITRVPFELINNHIYVAGAIDGKPARFLVDTGGVNLLTPAAARKFGLVAQGKLAARGVGEQEVDLGIAHAGAVRVGDAVLSRPVFYVVDLGDLDAVEGVVADGLVGYEMFRRFGVTIDYGARVLVLAETARFTPPAGAHRLAFEQAERIPVVMATLDGLPIRTSVDTGSRSSLTLHSPFVREHGLLTRYHADTEAVVGWGVGGPSRGRPARLGRLQLAGFDIDGVAGDLYTGDKGSFASPDLAANLGGGVLRRFTVAFDYANKAMYLAPNAELASPDPFDRSGLWLLASGAGLQVADVAADSAAARAGLRVGDRIHAIAGEAVTARTLDQWRQRLRELPPGTRLAVDYSRGGDRAHATLVLAERIAASWQPAPVPRGATTGR